MHLRLPQSRLFRLALLVISGAGLLPSHAWRPSLYPANWTPPDQASFTSDRLIQDFSYAGYRRGEEPIPEIAGPVFNAATTYGADPTGATDSTAAIQDAINAAVTAGGGVVYLPAGTYQVAPTGSNNFALRIQHSNIVLRGAGVGQTFILNTSYEMRSKSVIRIASPSTPLGTVITITADLDNPTRRIPVANASAFQVGDNVRMEWTFTQGWIDEHNQGTWWSEGSGPAPAEYLREVTAVNNDEGWIEIDVPTRYTMKTRDNASVRTIGGQLSGVGVESLSIGNVQHPGTAFGENDYTVEGTAAWDCHASWLVNVSNTIDSWITDVHSFQPAGNTSTCHMLSNGISLIRCARVTVANCEMRRGQYGGGGGNAYMYRVQHSHDNLIVDSIADFSRHGFVVSHAGTSGNVFLRCDDRETKRATGSTGSYETSGSGSDHHMHFSHSNLFDGCSAFNSFYTASHRGTSGTIPHGLTSAHGVYWNTSGSGTRYTNIVLSSQARYGYIIGTSGTRSGVSTPTTGNTAPVDEVEGVGIGASMQPQSLYLDQVALRAQGILLFLSEGASIPPTEDYPLNATAYSYGSGPISFQWTQLSGPTASIADPTSPDTTVDLLANGTYVFEVTAEDGDKSNASQVVITVQSITPATLVSVDGIRGRSQNEADNPPAYISPSSNSTVGGTGGEPNRTDWNVIYRYQLPVLPVGQTVSGFLLRFQITGLRDHDNKDYQLHAYLLDTDDPASIGTGLFYHGPNDAAHAFVGSHFVPSGTNTNTITLDTPVDVTIPIDSGPALALLQSFYDGHQPTQNEVAFRFNLDQLFPNNSLTGNALNRYILNNAVATTGFVIESIPGPGISFADWIADFDLAPGQQGFADDADDDGIPNGIEAWFGTHPGEFSTGIVMAGTSGLTATFTHPQNPDPPLGITGGYEWSPDLVNWYPHGGGPLDGPTVSFQAETEENLTTVTATASVAMPRVFLRVVVTP